MTTLFFSYSHADEALRDQLEKQLSALKRQGVIETWHDRRIGAGQEFGVAVDDHVNTDDVILLLVSADFLASDYCYDIEMRRAMERHEAGEAVVIPVILRACDWHKAPFGKLNAVPPDGKPITQYPDRDQAMLEVAKAIRAVAERRNVSLTSQTSVSIGPVSALQRSPGPRSSNLAVAKTFSDRDRDRFRQDSFAYLALFFENSLVELAARNRGIEGDFQKVDASRFHASVYKDGQAISRCTVFMGTTGFAGGIALVMGETTSSSNGYNEMLTVEADEQSLFLRSMGMQATGRSHGRLTQEGAAELYWTMLIRPLQ